MRSEESAKSGEKRTFDILASMSKMKLNNEEGWYDSSHFDDRFAYKPVYDKSQSTISTQPVTRKGT